MCRSCRTKWAVVAQAAIRVSYVTPVVDIRLGWQKVDSRAAFHELDAMWADDDRVPGLVEVLHGVAQSLDVVLDSDAADGDQETVLGSQAERRLNFDAVN